MPTHLPPSLPPSRPAGSPPLGSSGGRVGLADGAIPSDSRFANPDLRPAPVAERRWTTYNFAAPLMPAGGPALPAWKAHRAGGFGPLLDQPSRLVRRTALDLPDLYRPSGKYWYTGGWNRRALAAFATAGLPAIGGSHSAPGTGPFPHDGIVPFLKPLADYGWSAGMGSALGVMYVLLSTLLPDRRNRRPAGPRRDRGARKGAMV